MTARFICPHCHSPVDPLSLDAARSGGALFCICPVCDEPIPQACDAPETAVETRDRRFEAPALSRSAEESLQ